MSAAVTYMLCKNDAAQTDTIFRSFTLDNPRGPRSKDLEASTRSRLNVPLQILTNQHPDVNLIKARRVRLLPNVANKRCNCH